MEVLSKETLCLAFEAFSNVDPTARSQALGYIEKVELKPEYCSTLFQIYAQSNNDLHKVTALICLKNMVQSIFSGFRRGFKKDCPLSPDGIIELKQSVFKALANEFTLSYREKLNEMAVSISCTAFPTHFSEALEFSHYIVKQLADDLKRGALSLSQQTFQLLDTVRKICKTAARRRSQASPEYHKQVVESIFPSILEVWSHYYERLVLGQAGLMELQICSCIDAILIFVLRMGTPASIHGNPALVEVIKRLIQKSEAMMKVYSKIGRELETGYDSDLYLIWEKTAITLTYELAYVHNLSPMAFLPFLDDYLKYVVQLTLGSWPNITVKKSCLLMFYRSLKLRVQYSSNSLYFNQYSKDMQDLAKSKEQTYGQVISRETLEQLFSELLSKTMTVEEEGRENKLEVLLTDEEPDGIDQTNDELDCALRKIALSLIEQLVTTFSEESLDLIHKLTERMVTDQLAADIKTKDSIVSVVGLLPHLYLKTGVAKSSWMNIEPVLKWMASKGKEFIFFSRRYPMLVRMWTDIIDSETIRTFVGPLCELMASNDIVTKYSCISALKKIIKLEKEDKLPLMDILACVVPAILYICDNLNNPQLIWPVISILTNIMDKSKLSAQNQTVEMLEKINMDKLLEKNDKLIRSALIDMFKTIIVAAPFGTPLPAIFEVSLRFLTLALPKIEQYDTEELAFWHFFSKEITSVPEHAKVIAKHFAFANTMIPVASQKMDDSMQLDFLASVVDECLLLDSQQINFDVYDVLKNLLVKTYEFEHGDEIAAVKASVMKVYTTLLVLTQKSMQNDLSRLSPALELSCNEILKADKDIAVSGIMKLRSITLPFFNRLLISFGKDVVNYVKESCSFETFLEKWLYSMQYLNNSTTRKENVVAILGMVQMAPAKMISKIFEDLMREVVPVVFNYIDEQQGFKPNERPQVKNRMDSYSERKESLLKNSVVDGINILTAFKDSIKTFESNLQATNEKLAPFKNEGLQENLFKLMKAS